MVMQHTFIISQNSVTAADCHYYLWSLSKNNKQLQRIFDTFISCTVFLKFVTGLGKRWQKLWPGSK